jgi:hypothetical protein
MKDLDRFANGVTAPRKKVVGCQDNDSPKGDFGDSWADENFNIPSLPGPAGAPPNAVYKRWR